MVKDKAKAVLYIKERRRRIKIALVRLAGGACTQCEYNACLAALEFHHPDEESKDFGIASEGLCHSFQRLADEASKTVLLCARCHREAHNLIGFVLKSSPKVISESDLRLASKQEAAYVTGSLRHGTSSGYNLHKCRCSLCKDYHRVVVSRYRNKLSLKKES